MDGQVPTAPKESNCSRVPPVLIYVCICFIYSPLRSDSSHPCIYTHVHSFVHIHLYTLLHSPSMRMYVCMCVYIYILQSMDRRIKLSTSHVHESHTYCVTCIRIFTHTLTWPQNCHHKTVHPS